VPSSHRILHTRKRGTATKIARRAHLSINKINTGITGKEEKVVVGKD
jgi:hypothetical protein